MSSSRRRGQRSVRVPLSPLVAGDITLPSDVATYVRDVLRMSAGDSLTFFDPVSRLEAEALLIDVRGSVLVTRVAELRSAKVVARRPVTLIQGMAKGDKMDAIIRDATELGATQVAPVIMERSVSRPTSDDGRTERWRRIALQAARQCGRGDVPEIDPPAAFDKALRRCVQDSETVSTSAFCLDPGASIPLRDRLHQLAPMETVIVVVGPEGGVSDAELALCDELGVHRVSIGPLILRTETVCAAVLGALLVLAGESGTSTD